MTPRMKTFLEWASQWSPGNGYPPRPSDRNVANNAVNCGFGELLGAPGFVKFIISDYGREMLAKASPSTPHGGE